MERLTDRRTKVSIGKVGEQSSRSTRQNVKRTDEVTDKLIEKLTDKVTDKLTDRQTDRQTEVIIIGKVGEQSSWSTGKWFLKLFTGLVKNEQLIMASHTIWRGLGGGGGGGRGRAGRAG